jgi:hypothetical protein
LGLAQSTSDEEGPEEPSAEDAEFFRLFFGPVDEPSQETSLRAELDQAQGRIEELKQEAVWVKELQERVYILEAEAEDGEVLRLRIQELEHQLKIADHACEAMRQSSWEWQTKFQAEQAGRQDAERMAEDYRSQLSVWQKGYQLLQSQLDTSSQVIADLHADIQRLEPLKVWAGHPCSVCHKSMSGSVDRALAARIRRDLAHHRCLNNQGTGLAKMLLAGGILCGLSQLNKM